VTILVSKSAGRYRLQSGCFEALWLVAAELFRRLTAYFDSAGASSKGEGPFAVTFTETLPLQDFFNLVDEHFAVRQALLSTNLLGTFREHLGNVQGTFREHSGNIQGTHREHSVNFATTVRCAFAVRFPRPLPRS
jgi:hypothetical protein